MNKVDKSQVIVLFFLACLLVITHFLPSSLRPTYLYLIFNILIIALAAQAGILSPVSEPSEDTKHAMQEPQEKEVSAINNVNFVSDEQKVKKPKVVEKSSFEMEKKCPTMPSLFYIEDGEDCLEVNKNEEIEVEDEICSVNGQELFAKAEAFIGNFYKQLKMQREESCAS